MPSLIDTHCHLDRFLRSGDLPGVLARARDAGVESMIAIGTDTGDWTLNRDLAAAHPGVVHFTAGLHPCNVTAGWKSMIDQLEPFWGEGASVKPVGIGEMGLDRFHLPKDPAEAERAFQWQREAFTAGLAVARKLDCPMVVHSREAFAECVAMIDASGVDWSKVVFHCFSEGPAEAAELTKRGGRASFTGILTYKNAETVRAAARAQGLDRLMIETDAPYLAPVPHRGKTNEPALVRHTAEYAAALFGIPMDQFASISTANARSFFGL